MRNVIYFCAGTVADFPIDDARYQDFIERLDPSRGYSETELTRSRGALERFLRAAEEDAAILAGGTELSAACHVWHYFNTNPDEGHRIDGDIMIVDLNGHGETIEYVAAADIQLAPED
ncbi:MAG: hypothetical protein ABT940_10290 [Alphaproteobacteria bacterium]